jgi:hypothetical protein
MTPERWLPVTGYEGLYSISDHGHARGEPRVIKNSNGGFRKWKGKLLKVSQPRPGNRAIRYPTVTLYKDGIPNKVRIHNLVAEHFIGRRPKGAEVLHWDDNPLNAIWTNLRYGSHAENRADMIRNRTHCKRRHLWNFENTYIRPDTGTRQCRACAKENKLRTLIP